MTAITIPTGETGMIRVFAVNRPIPDVKAAIEADSKSAVATELLGADLNAEGIELFPMSDLEGVGLAHYLTDGYAAQGVTQDKTKLDRLDGYVLLVFSRVADTDAVTLRPGSEVTLIGTYAEERADMTATQIDSAAALPYTGSPQLTPAQPPQGKPGAMLVVLGLVVMVLLLIWWIWT